MSNSQSHEEAAIEALVLAKRDRTPESLIRLNADDREALKRTDYLRAAENGVPLLFALAIRRLGTCGEGKVWTWQSGAITAKYDEGAATLRVTVGDVLAMSDELPGREVMIPGQWCFTLHDAYQQALAREDAERRQASTRRAAKQIDELTADI